jgi:hypothetical protein
MFGSRCCARASSVGRRIAGDGNFVRPKKRQIFRRMVWFQVKAPALSGQPARRLATARKHARADGPERDDASICKKSWSVLDKGERRFVPIASDGFRETPKWPSIRAPLRS